MYLLLNNYKTIISNLLFTFVLINDETLNKFEDAVKSAIDG